MTLRTLKWDDMISLYGIEMSIPYCKFHCCPVINVFKLSLIGIDVYEALRDQCLPQVWSFESLKYIHIWLSLVGCGAPRINYLNENFAHNWCNLKYWSEYWCWWGCVFLEVSENVQKVTDVILLEFLLPKQVFIVVTRVKEIEKPLWVGARDLLFLLWPSCWDTLHHHNCCCLCNICLWRVSRICSRLPRYFCSNIWSMWSCRWDIHFYFCGQDCTLYRQASYECSYHDSLSSRGCTGHGGQARCFSHNFPNRNDGCLWSEGIHGCCC